MDPDGEYARTHVLKCVDALSSSPADQLAIVPRTSGRTIVERALSAVQSTKLAFAAGAELAFGSEPVPALLGAVRRWDGAHLPGLAASLPLGGCDGTDQPFAVPEVPAVPAGLLLGRNRRGEPARVPFFRPDPTRVLLIGGLTWR